LTIQAGHAGDGGGTLAIGAEIAPTVPPYRLTYSKKDTRCMPVHKEMIDKR
jgi:hypothetical protein